jgi:hypothetical protein
MAIDAISSYRNTVFALDSRRPVGAGSTKDTDLYKQLDDYVKMTPAERMRGHLLQKLGLTEEELAVMSPEERQSVETKLRELVQQQMQEAQADQGAPDKVGQWVNTVA